ncbi:DUF3455 domain-containing protein [Janthinobacterium sp.]|uniref:DUF3455 domain-containing protein n=1 Tax=Janthinobacterium sp. TaxID=1871054 RepID=UPI00293D4CBD|nr:DUF3455 domain-containing protein [Janthinobacterium sp.]
MKYINVMVATLLALAAHSAASAPTEGMVPPRLKAPPGQALALEARASGVQIYTCAPRPDDPARYEWRFKAPEADLYDAAGAKIGRHYAGPTWEAADGSLVVGELMAHDRGPDPRAIPWLLLGAKSHAGSGLLSDTSSIQRLYTTGGQAPGSGCDRAGAGRESRVPYTATYYFYAARG